MATSPYYNKPSQSGIRKHYELIADQAQRPVIMYNVPGRTASNIEADTTLALAKHPNILGTKEASGDIIQCMEIAAGKPDDFHLISGDDAFTVPMISIGASGLVSVVANALPEMTSKMVDLALSSDFVKAREVAFDLMKPIELAFEEGSPVGVKYMMKQLGLCSDSVRLPLTLPSEQLQSKINVYLQSR